MCCRKSEARPSFCNKFSKRYAFVLPLEANLIGCGRSRRRASGANKRAEGDDRFLLALLKGEKNYGAPRDLQGQVLALTDGKHCVFPVADRFLCFGGGCSSSSRMSVRRNAATVPATAIFVY